MSREGLMDDAGYQFFECEKDCSECDNKDCISNVVKEEVEE